MSHTTVQNEVPSTALPALHTPANADTALIAQSRPFSERPNADFADFRTPLRNLSDSPIAKRFYSAARQVWEEGYKQPFIRDLEAGSLTRARFTFYMLQDYLYLTDYAKVHALIMAKAQDDNIVEHMVEIQAAIAKERSSVHEVYVKEYGITMDEILHAKQSAFARAYTSNILSIAFSRPVLDILVAVLPCAWVYADYGRRLSLEAGDNLASNPYRTWVDIYASDDFWQGAVWLINTIDKLAMNISESEMDGLVDIFVTGVEHEYMFWSSAYDMQLTWKPGWQRH
ncbi:thiaminase II [Bifidobacterium aquikefiri]|uniref:thiaminase II n=1 Tax=Bifidobacterium aquikefiri TaxID=1653207 RepID=UPI0039E85021